MKNKALQHLFNRRSFAFIILLHLISVSLAQSQSITNYTFAGTTGTFTALSGSSTLPAYTGSVDDGYSNGIPIGFDFYYMGTRYTTASASTNGWITLGANITDAQTTNDLSGGGSPRPVIAPLWDDLSIQSTANVTYLTTGTAPNRIFTIEYLNVKWNYNATGNTMSFQVKLYETSCKVEFVYRAESGAYTGICCLGLGNTGGASIGISSSGTGAGNFLSLNGTGTTPTASSTTSTNNLTTKPATNTTYTFTPSSTGVTAPSNLTYSNVSISIMTLNWTDNSSNETGFEIYNSTDNINFTFVGHVAANTTSYTTNLLTGNTVYYWRVYATREVPGTPLSGNRQTCSTLSAIPTHGLASIYKFNGNANDEAGINNGTFQGGTPTATTDRFGNANKAYNFNGSSNYVSTAVSYNNPSNFSLSIWIKTTTVTGGRLIGFGDAQTGNSGSRERMIYMANDGKIYFAVNPGGVGYVINSTASYNDGNWHNIVATCSNAVGGGTRLYIDGALIASNTSALGGQTYVGWWRINYDLIGWVSSPTSNYFLGAMDDVLIYDRAISAAEASSLYAVTSDGAGSNTPVCYGSTVNLTSTTMTGAAYSWTGPNNFSAATQNPSVTSAVTGSAGTYSVAAAQDLCNSSASTTVAITYNSILQIPSAGLIGNYKFNGNAYDESNTNPGTLQNAPTATTDRFGIANSALSFNGSTQYVSTTNLYANPGTFTVSIWFNTTSTTGGKLIGLGSVQTGQSPNYDRHIYMNDAGQIYFGVNPSPVKTINSPLSYNDGNWHMATASLSPTNGMRLYIDGVLIVSDATTVSAQNYSGYWRIGYDNVAGWTTPPTSFFFNGKLDDVLIYTTELTAAQVTTLYTSPDGASNNGPVCVGNNSVTLSGTTLASATYSWTGPNGYSSATQNPSFNFTTAAYAGTYTLTVTKGGCSVKAYTLVNLNTTTAGLWTGFVDNSWQVTNNWCGGALPLATTNVTIPSVTNLPVNNGTALANNISINSPASLTNTAAGTINIYGNWVNAGTFTDNGTYISGGSVNFLGTAAQSISGAGTNTFSNLIVNNSNGLTLNAASAATINGILTLTLGVFSTNSKLIQNLYTGGIAGTGAGSTTGNIQFNKTVWGDRYHYMSVPISGLTAADWNDDVTVKFGANSNLYSYNEALLDTNRKVGWTAVPSTATALTSLKGYALFFPRWIYNTMIDVTGPYNHSATFSSGTLNNTPSTTPVFKPASDGWQLMGNPYPSNLDWDAVSGWTKTGIDNAIYSWDGRTNRYISYVAGIGTNGGTKYIGSMQGFFIKVSASGGTGSLAVNNTARVTTTLKDVWRTGDDDKVLRLKIAKDTSEDETIIRFTNAASELFDSNLDAYKLLNDGTTPSLFSLSADADYSINSLPKELLTKTIPLQLNVMQEGEHHWNAELSSFDSDLLSLEDRLVDTIYDLSTYPTFSMTLTKGEQKGRFYLHYTKKESMVTADQPATPNTSGSIEISAVQQNILLFFTERNSGTANISVFDAVGKKVYTLENASIISDKIEFSLPNSPTGVYIVKVQTSASSKTRQVFVQK